jgi:hypothetical protein
MDPIDAQTNGPQLFYGLRYHIHINTPEEDITFHDQVGYWLYEAGDRPHHADASRFRAARCCWRRDTRSRATGISRSLKAERGQNEYGICSTTFLDLAFRTDSYQLTVDFHDDGSWSYVSDTMLAVKGRDEPFLHRDHNRLSKIAEPDLNPWAKIVRGAA